MPSPQRQALHSLASYDYLTSENVLDVAQKRFLDNCLDSDIMVQDNHALGSPACVSAGPFRHLLWPFQITVWEELNHHGIQEG